jgi:hypothetical protein
VSTKDPRRYFRYRDANNNGYNVLAIGKGSLLFSRGNNTDSQSKMGGILNLTEVSTTGTDDVQIRENGAYGPSTISNGSSVSVHNAYTGMNNLYYTTDYPTLITCNWWPKDDMVHGSPIFMTH